MQEKVLEEPTIEPLGPVQDSSTMNDSRLRKRQERETKKYLTLTLIIGGIVAISLLFFGIPLLLNFSSLVAKIKGEPSVQTVEEGNAFVTAPFLSTPYDATNSAEITITAEAEKGQRVKLYVNDEVVEEKEVNSENTATFRDVTLSEGENKIEALTITKSKDKSRLSDPIIVLYIKDPPTLDIEFPSDGAEIKGSDNRIVVRGKTDPNARVTVNSFQATTDDDGNFRYTLSLNGGDNTFKVVATDQAGNKTETERRVIYSP